LLFLATIDEAGLKGIKSTRNSNYRDELRNYGQIDIAKEIETISKTLL